MGLVDHGEVLGNANSLGAVYELHWRLILLSDVRHTQILAKR